MTIATVRSKQDYGQELQFGHGPSTVDDLLAWLLADLFGTLQFGHGPSTVDDRVAGCRGHPRTRSFNSATALRPWMTRQLQGHPDGGLLASIRPRPFDRG